MSAGITYEPREYLVRLTCYTARWPWRTYCGECAHSLEVEVEEHADALRSDGSVDCERGVPYCDKCGFPPEKWRPFVMRGIAAIEHPACKIF